ncbi:uncharacterized protein [Lolium perenne]|uniref:uncharacterized protein n=1 Tax=Lolium perenne TaxID=4522 RepID=UPI0021EB4615|nr:zinc finger protein ZAT8-like [Lolium perenne]
MNMARSNARSPPVKLIQLLLTLSSPAAASRVITKCSKNKRVQLQAQHGGAFECRTCGRRFSTFQALGGHRTSHKRPRVRAHGLDLLLGARPGKARAPVEHRCGTCGQTFPTGQALGGHMRRHRPLSSVAAVAAATWTTEETTETLSSSPSSGLSSDRDDDAWPTLIQFI